ncbi:hypothetical protein ACKWTF_006626 [Chironomus riparius]
MSEIKEEQESSKESTKFAGFPTMDEFSKNGMKLIMEATKTINALPSGSSRDLYSTHSSFSKVMSYHNNDIINVIHNVIQHKGIKGNITKRDKEEKFEILQEFNDAILETINYNLDDMQGIRKITPTINVQEVKVPQTPQYQLSTTIVTAKFDASTQSAKLITAKNILRPQTTFKTLVDNSTLTPFIPRIKDKPNSLRPLALLPEYDDDGTIINYLHPYELEIEKFEPTNETLMKREPQVPEDITNFPYNYVETEEQLNAMVEELRSAKEIAVDLEHHSYRTFLGITCLMQISSRTKDYIIDTIALRDELHILNEIFTRSSIIKIFHGSDCDIEWLQRDLALYVVNMFDTHQAAKRLGLARLSLAFLLKHYCNIDADKSFQLADWRMRPLPENLLKYAQQDTHYLLYIFDKIVNDLLSASNEQSTLVKGVYHDSKILCMKRYLKPIIHENSYKDMFLKSKRSFNNQQIYALREIFLWRDKIAREEDESCGYILPNHMLLQIAESLPREMQGILACCNPIPPMIRQNLNHLHQIILKAREQPIIKPIINDKDAVRQTVNLNNKRDLLNHPLYSPHDLSHQQEIRDDLPTLIGSNKLKESFKDIIINEISLNVFDKNQNGYGNSQKELEIKFISPYHRYKLMIPFMEAQRKKEQAEAEENRKKMLEEKKKQLPELEIVKIGNDEDVEEVPLRVVKRKSDGTTQQQPQYQNKRWRKEANREPELPNNYANEMDIESKLQEVATVVENMKNKNKKFNKKGKAQKASDFRQSSNKPVPFDYSSVSYDRFQGGSSNGNSNQKDQKNNQKFKGGKKGKGNNNIDKMFNFSNFRLNKR